MKNLNSSDVDKSSSVTFEICGNSKFLSRCLFVTVFHEYLSTKIPRYIHHNSRNPSLTFLLPMFLSYFPSYFFTLLRSNIFGFSFFSSPRKVLFGGKKIMVPRKFSYFVSKTSPCRAKFCPKPRFGPGFRVSYRPMPNGLSAYYRFPIKHSFSLEQKLAPSFFFSKNTKVS